MNEKEKMDENHLDEKYSMDTHLIYGKNVSNKWDYSHHVTAPISSSTTFRLDSVERGAEGFMQFAHTAEHGHESPIFIYDRLGEPNKDMLEENLAYVEKGEIVGHIKDVMVTGNIYDTLNSIVGIENTLYPDSGGNYPSILLDSVNVTIKK